MHRQVFVATKHQKAYPFCQQFFQATLLLLAGAAQCFQKMYLAMLLNLSSSHLFIFITFILSKCNLCWGGGCPCFCKGFGGFIALTFPSNTYLMTTCINIFTWFILSLINRLLIIFTQPFYSMLFYCIAFMNRAQTYMYFVLANFILAILLGEIEA